MALTDESNGNGFYMPVAPAYNGGYSNGGFGGFGGDWGWIVLLLLLAGGGGWGMGGGFGGFGNMMLGYDFPWLLNGQQSISNNVSDGFRDAQLHDSVASVRDGVSNLTTQLCNCCGDMQMSIANAQSALSTQLCNNEIASLNRSFAEQTANMQGFNGVQAQLAQCCCDNRLATESLRATVLAENCADRYEAANNTRDIIESQTRGTQAIIDKLCALELDGYKRENDNLRTQLNMANLAASQTAQTSRLLADNAAQTVALEQYLNPVPVPAYIVQNPNCCTNSCGCGCGNNVGGFNGTF